uniref:Glycosyltransferase n=1 Tax=Candidatus Caldatribacterium californiense TaxID=1454726 RepID=A0A7V4DFR2_9BACT
MIGQNSKAISQDEVFFPGILSFLETLFCLGKTPLLKERIPSLEEFLKRGSSFCHHLDHLHHPSKIIDRNAKSLTPQSREKNCARHYREATVFLFTSWYEGFGLPPLEAMASGTAVVATDCGGIRTYAQEGYNVLLAEPGDVDSLAYALVFLLQNEEARKILEERGRATALEFSLEKQALKLEEVLQGIARNASLFPFSRTTG